MSQKLDFLFFFMFHPEGSSVNSNFSRRLCSSNILFAILVNDKLYFKNKQFTKIFISKIILYNYIRVVCICDAKFDLVGGCYQESQNLGFLPTLLPPEFRWRTQKQKITRVIPQCTIQMSLRSPFEIIFFLIIAVCFKHNFS